MGTFLGGPYNKCWYFFWGPLILGNYHLSGGFHKQGALNRSTSATTLLVRNPSKGPLFFRNAPPVPHDAMQAFSINLGGLKGGMKVGGLKDPYCRFHSAEPA